MGKKRRWKELSPLSYLSTHSFPKQKSYFFWRQCPSPVKRDGETSTDQMTVTHRGPRHHIGESSQLHWPFLQHSCFLSFLVLSTLPLSAFPTLFYFCPCRAQSVNQPLQPLENILLHSGRVPSWYYETQLLRCSHSKKFWQDLQLPNNLERNKITLSSCLCF